MEKKEKKVLSHAQEEALKQPLPAKALKSHPTKQNMTVINPMYVIERLNFVFGVGGWSFKTTLVSCVEKLQKTRNGDREVYNAAVIGILDIEDYGIHLEQFGGNTNDDRGDALKGSATDALTKIASYLGIGSSIYKGEGNIGGETSVKRPVTPQDVFDPTSDHLGEPPVLEGENQAQTIKRKR